MLQPADPPPKGAKHVIIPAYSNQEDGGTSSVVLLLDPLFIELVEYRQHNLGIELASDPQLVRKVFMQPHGLFKAYYTHDQEEPVDPPTVVTELCRHMQVMDGDDGVVSFVPLLMAELHIGRNTFWFEWGGADLTDGGTETYYTESLELKDLPSLEGSGEKDDCELNEILYDVTRSLKDTKEDP